MEKILNTLNGYNLWYVPIAAIATIAVFAAIVGAASGWKTATYFLCWNIVGSLAIVFVSKFFGVKLLNWVVDKFVLAKEPTIGNVLKESEISQIAIKLLILALLFVGMFIWNFIAFIFYLIFRHWLKKTIKQNKKNNISNAGARFAGAGIAVLSSIPMGVSLGTMSTIVSKNNQINKYFSSLTRVVSYNQVQNIKDNIDGIYHFVDAIKPFSQIAKSLSDVSDKDFSSEGSTAKEKKERADLIKKLLGNNDYSVIVSKLTKHLFKKEIQTIDPADLAKVAEEINKHVDKLKLPLASKNKIIASKRRRLKNILGELLVKPDKNKTKWSDIQLYALVDLI